MVKKQYSFKTGLSKTIKNVSIVITPAIVLEIINNFTLLVPAEYLPVAQFIVSAMAYLVKNASDNGAWK